MASFEFHCDCCGIDWIVADLEGKVDVSQVLCVECSSNRTKLTGFSAVDNANVLDLARRLALIEERVDALERYYDDEEEPALDDADC